jgi:RNA polymerase sigma factor (sigma-70 family)
MSATPTAAAPPPLARGRGSGTGAAEATRDLYERYERRILAFCMSRLRNRQEAEDALQNTFVYAYKLLERGVVPDAELPWLFTIAHNVCRSRRRALWRRGHVEVPTDLDALQDVVGAPSGAGGESVAALSGALASMPETQRRALLLREWQGLSYAEIGARLSLSQSAVETLLFRARRNLAKQLAPVYDRVAVALNGFVLLRLVRRLTRTSVATKTTAAVVAAGVVAGAGIPLDHALRHPARPTQPASITTPAADSTTLLPLRPAARDPLRRDGAPSAATGRPPKPAARAPHARSALPTETRRTQPQGQVAPTSVTAAPSPPAPTTPGPEQSAVRDRVTTTATKLLQRPLKQTVDHATSAVPDAVSQASQTVSTAITQADATVSTVVSSVEAGPAGSTTGAPAAAISAVQQTVTNVASAASTATPSNVVTTAGTTASNLLGRGSKRP